MGEAISSTNPPQENASGGILQEGNRPPGKDAAACQPEAQGIVLHNREQPAEQSNDQPTSQPGAQSKDHASDWSPEQPSGQANTQSDDEPADQSKHKPIFCRTTDTFIRRARRTFHQFFR